jgi:hypothetical protein
MFPLELLPNSHLSQLASPPPLFNPFQTAVLGFIIRAGLGALAFYLSYRCCLSIHVYRTVVDGTDGSSAVHDRNNIT